MKAGMKVLRFLSAGKTVQQPKDYVASTDLLTLPIHKQVPFIGTIAAGTFQPSGVLTGSFALDIPHDLGFPPLFMAWAHTIDTSTSPWSMRSTMKRISFITGGTDATGSGTGFRIYVDAISDSKKVTIKYSAADTGTPPIPGVDEVVVKGYAYIFNVDYRSWNSA